MRIVLSGANAINLGEA